MEAVALLSLILDDLAQKQNKTKKRKKKEEFTMRNKTFAEKVGLKTSFSCGQKERMGGNVILFTVTRILLAEAMGFKFLICI